MPGFRCATCCVRVDGFMVMANAMALSMRLPCVTLLPVGGHHTARHCGPSGVSKGSTLERQHLHAEPDRPHGEMGVQAGDGHFPANAGSRIKRIGFCRRRKTKHPVRLSYLYSHGGFPLKANCGGTDTVGGLLGLIEPWRQLTLQAVGWQLSQGLTVAATSFAVTVYANPLDIDSAIVGRI